MKIHVVHSNSFDFKNELYFPLRNSELNKLHQLFLPHETDTFIKTKDLIKNADVILAEVSYPSIGLGIELGWADAVNRPIIWVYKKGSKISSSLQAISNNFSEYSTSEELITRISEILNKMKI